MFYTANDLFPTDPGTFPFIDQDQEPPPINPMVQMIAAIAVIAAAVPLMQETIVPSPTTTTAITTTATVATTTTTVTTTTTGTHFVCLCQANLLAWDSFFIDIFRNKKTKTKTKQKQNKTKPNRTHATPIIDCYYLIIIFIYSLTNETVK